VLLNALRVYATGHGDLGGMSVRPLNLSLRQRCSIRSELHVQ